MMVMTGDISNLKKDKVVTSRDATLHIKPPKVPNQVYSQPIVRLPHRPPDPPGSNPKATAKIETYVDFEENSPHQEGIISEMYESPDKSYLEQPQELSDLVDSTKIIHKYLTSGYRQEFEYYKKKGLERHTFITYYQRDTNRLHERFLFQALICVSGTQ